ncbi:MAG: carbamoyltransferase HypF [Gemmatimonadaceae bacterium]
MVAVKGVGGVHLACDATREAVVARLRTRKQRSDKPFALLAPDVETARRFAAVHDDEERLLAGVERPIVLLDRRHDATLAIAGNVAPGQRTLGVMLPPSPLHVLLATVGPLVLTSGNLSEEPIAREDDEALERLAAIADGFLLHDRAIHVVCDDSVVRWHDGGELPLRRSRGYAPYPVRLSRAVPPVLAVGAELKATACLARDRYAFLTPHIGDLGNLETLQAMERACDHFERLFRVSPDRIACDLHPGYLSTRWARERGAARGLPVVAVQHHHAHLVALAAEHGLAPDEPLLAFTFDGTGYGSDGTIWGGEVLLGDARGFERVAHLNATPLPGGDAAVRHPARVALAQLWAAGDPWDGTHAAAALSPGERALLRTQLERRLNTVTTTSMGRFLDAASALAGVRQEVSYEGQAAIEFEALARDGAVEARYAFDVHATEALPLCMDGAPVLRQVAADAARGRASRDIARAVHEALADGIVIVADALRARCGIDRVGLTGGVFQNVLLLSLASARLRAAGFTVLRHHRVPPNDGGLALGQAIIAACEDIS